MKSVWQVDAIHLCLREVGQLEIFFLFVFSWSSDFRDRRTYFKGPIYGSSPL